MRKLFILLGLIALCGCEVIDEADRLIPVPLPVNSERRHVLLEFTGFKCMNCPAAAEQAAALKALYRDNLILISLHPASNPFTQGLYDYTCPEADSIYRFMGGTASTPFPTGSIDMRLFDDSYFIAPADWPTKLQQIINHKSQITNPTDTSYWLVEDSVLGAQAMPDGTVNMAYYHRHVLRLISSEPVKHLPEACNPAHCSVVTIFSDKNDKHILQAYETPFDLSAYH